MGQCGCGEYQPDQQFRLKDCIVGIQLYQGCNYCEEIFVIVPEFFALGTEWTDDHPTVTVTPDEYGAQERGIPVFAVSDLIEASKLVGGEVGPEDHQYENIQDWLEDNGLNMMRRAVELCRRRNKWEPTWGQHLPKAPKGETSGEPSTSQTSRRDN